MKIQNYSIDYNGGIHTDKNGKIIHTDENFICVFDHNIPDKDLDLDFSLVAAYYFEFKGGAINNKEYKSFSAWKSAVEKTLNKNINWDEVFENNEYLTEQKQIEILEDTGLLATARRYNKSN